jgi:uncharacterized protein YggE
MHALTNTVAAAGLAALVLAGCGSSGASEAKDPKVTLTAAHDTNTPTVNVTGHGKVEGTPDTVTVRMGVETRGTSAQAAMDDNNTKAATLIQTLKDKGVAAKDIQTSDLSVYPNWDDKQRITGYTVANIVTVRMHDIAKAGAIVDAAAAGAGDDIRLQGVAFSIDDTSALFAKARADAVKDALAQSRQLADAAGVKLGAIRTIDNTTAQVPQPMSYAGDAAKRALSDQATPLEAGTQELTVDVNVVLDIVT